MRIHYIILMYVYISPLIVQKFKKIIENEKQLLLRKQQKKYNKINRITETCKKYNIRKLGPYVICT